MNKQIAIERIFSLGDYQNIKVTDVITEIPDAVASNPEAIKLLRYLQLVDIEWTYIHYAKLRATEPKLSNLESIETAMSFIEKERTITFENLLKAISDKPGTEENKKLTEEEKGV
jgi:uncharacterized LabA/DUF88 family protein